MSEMLERGAAAIELDVGDRLDTPYGYRRAIDKSSYEVYFLDYPEWREVIDDAVIMARYHREDEAKEHAQRLQHRFVVRAILTAALDPEDAPLLSEIALEIWLKGFPPGDDSELRTAWARYIHMPAHQRDATVNQAIRYAHTALVALRKNAEAPSGLSSARANSPNTQRDMPEQPVSDGEPDRDADA